MNGCYEAGGSESDGHQVVGQCQSETDHDESHWTAWAWVRQKEKMFLVSPVLMEMES
jgi:hypothetical protein